MNYIINHIITTDLIKIISFLALYIALFFFAKIIKDLLTPYKINDQLTKKDNSSPAIIMSGYYLAITLIFVGAFVGPSHGLQTDLLSVALYSVIGIILLNLSRFINDKIILRKFCNIEQIIQKNNIAVSSSQFGSYVATGLIAGGSIAGEGGNIITFIAFFILGQISLFLFSLIYEFFTKYNIYDELEKNNKSAGVAFGGTLIALGIIISNGVYGDFISWKASLIEFAFVNILAFIFLPIIRIFMDKLIIPGNKLCLEIQKNQNFGAGFLEATIIISFSIILNIII